MANDIVTLVKNQNFTERVRLLQHYGNEFRQQVVELKAAVDHMVAADFITLEAQLGIPTGSGESFRNRLNTAATAVANADGIAGILDGYVIGV